MSSSISSSDPHRRYVQGLLVLVAAPWLALLAFGMYLQPVYGDLTRIGSHAEKDFGWNKPQLEFAQFLSKVGRYDRYFDVVVLGDSFSLGRLQHSWQNYVVAATGWSVLTLDAKAAKPEQILENPVFRVTPPKVFIFETVERSLPGRVTRRMPCDASGSSAGAYAPLLPPSGTTAVHAGEKKEGVTRYVSRNSGWDEIQPEHALKYLRNELTRRLGGEVVTEAPKLALSRPAPFSSANRHELLVYRDDLRKVSWWNEMPLPEKVCRIEGLRKRFEGNGKTRFVLMVAPDKLTAYADFLLDGSLRDASGLWRFADLVPQFTPRLDRALISAIKQGVEDVYLPNDTHWGSTGHRIAAEALLAFLQLEGARSNR